MNNEPVIAPVLPPGMFFRVTAHNKAYEKWTHSYGDCFLIKSPGVCVDLRMRRRFWFSKRLVAHQRKTDKDATPAQIAATTLSLMEGALSDYRKDNAEQIAEKIRNNRLQQVEGDYPPRHKIG